MAMIGNIFHDDDVSATYCLSLGSTMRVPGYGHTRIYQESYEGRALGEDWECSALPDPPELSRSLKQSE